MIKCVAIAVMRNSESFIISGDAVWSMNSLISEFGPIWSSRVPNLKEIQSYLETESLFNMAIASCTVVINCAGKMMVEFFSVAISAIVCSVRS